MVEVRYYVTAEGRNVVEEWLNSLRDERAQARIAARITRLSAGNLGDCKSLQEGVWELRIDYGPGYRVYFGKVDRTCVLLLCGGDKRRQSADIRRSITYWKDFQQRTGQP